MTDREFAEFFMKALYSKYTGRLLFCIYKVSKEEIETLEPLIGYPEFKFTKEQTRVYGALQRKYGINYWKPRERPLKLPNLFPIIPDDIETDCLDEDYDEDCYITEDTRYKLDGRYYFKDYKRVYFSSDEMKIMKGEPIEKH